MRNLPRLGLLATALLASSCSRNEAPVVPAVAPVAATPATTVTPAQNAVFTVEELDQMLAPIALYPDPLLAQVLMAATYPGDFADAVAWSAAHRDAKGDAAVLQVANQPWDPSVQALVAFPQALATIGHDLAWVQKVGDAFLANPDAVMDSVQRLRHKAKNAGNLASNEYQNVVLQTAPAPSSPAPAPMSDGSAPPLSASDTIIIEPANPEVVYVPSYDSTTAYGDWGYPSYPPPYYAPPPYYYPGGALARGIAFGIGVGIVNSLWGNMTWGGGGNDININSSRYNNINVNNQINGGDRTFKHNAANRDGVPYRDNKNREQNSRRLDGASDRDAFRGDDARRAESREQARGDDARRDQSREQARSSMEKRGIEPARNNSDARDSARRAESDRTRDQSAASSRDTERENARNAARAADRSAAANRSAAAERSAAANRDGDRQGGGDRANADARQGASGDRASSYQSGNRTPDNDRARQDARNRQASDRSGGGDAFQGAGRPSQSRSESSRGHASQQSAQRPSGSRSSGQPTQRSSSPPQRSGGGGRR